MRVALLTIVLAGLAILAWAFWPDASPAAWTPEELALIRSLSLTELESPPADHGNGVADSPAAARLGQRLFFAATLSANDAVSCATCHRPDQFFTDGRVLAVGLDTGPRHTPSLVGLAYSPWFYWDGRKDSQWSQALAPLEAGHEHGLSRLQVARRALADNAVSESYAELFSSPPSLPDTPESASPVGSKSERQAWKALAPEQREQVNRVFSNLGKALAAYQRRLLPGRSRFDAYADSLSEAGEIEGDGSLTAEERAGLALFIGKGQCINCHNGPLLTNFEFHNTGVLSVAGQLPPMGRYDGIRAARSDPFNCLGPYSDARPEQCLELRFARDDNALVGAHKTPTLRGVAETAPYMHGGQIADLEAVMEHYNDAPTSMLSHNEAKPLGLRQRELRQLVAFLKTLSAPLATPDSWLQAPD